MMKKTFLILTVLTLAFAQNVMAQNNHPALFGNNNKHLRVGVGINSAGIPIEVSYDQGFKENLFGVSKLNLGLGGYLGYYDDKEQIGFGNDGDFGYKYSYIVLGARGLFHYPLIPKVDTYAGLMLGYNIASAKFYGNGTDPGSASAGGLTFGGVLGARYQFNNKMGMYAEAGYSISYLSIGLVFSL
ncbi:MAG: hypothetical protein PHP33_03665 [Bacteroidales bacterium]|nr:hypothetical protein [Bacteroidales bacterium]